MSFRVRVVAGLLAVAAVAADGAAHAQPPPAPAPAPLPGAPFVGRSLQLRTQTGTRTFTIERKLGQGASGVTFLARDEQQAVAVKVARPGSFRDRTMESFQHDANVAAKLEGASNGIAGAYGVGRMVRGGGNLGQRVLVMQLAAGRPLGTQGDHAGNVWQTPRQPRPPVAAARIVLRASEILGAMHDRGFAHNDVHPGNLRMRDGDPGSLTLIDFNSTRPLDPNGRQRDIAQLGRMIAYLTTSGAARPDAMPNEIRVVGGRPIALADVARKAIAGGYASMGELHQALAPFAARPQ